VCCFSVEFKLDDYFGTSYFNTLHYDSTKKEIKEWINGSTIEVFHWLDNNPDAYVNICSLDIWGNKKDGYDFNNLLSVDKITTIKEFIDYWSNGTFNLISKRVLKKVGYTEY